jgi:hypothetical protein
VYKNVRIGPEGTSCANLRCARLSANRPTVFELSVLSTPIIRESSHLHHYIAISPMLQHFVHTRCEGVNSLGDRRLLCAWGSAYPTIPMLRSNDLFIIVWHSMPACSPDAYLALPWTISPTQPRSCPTINQQRCS